MSSCHLPSMQMFYHQQIIHSRASFILLKTYVGSDWLIIFVFIFSNTKSADIYRIVVLFLSTCIYLFMCLFIDFLFKVHHVLSLPLLQRAFTAKAAGEKKEASISLYITASQSAWRYPNTCSWACKSCEPLQAAAVNNDLFVVHLPGAVRVKTVCLASVRCDS